MTPTHSDPAPAPLEGADALLWEANELLRGASSARSGWHSKVQQWRMKATAYLAAKLLELTR